MAILPVFLFKYPILLHSAHVIGREEDKESHIPDRVTVSKVQHKLLSFEKETLFVLWYKNSSHQKSPISSYFCSRFCKLIAHCTRNSFGIFNLKYGG